MFLRKLMHTSSYNYIRIASQYELKQWFQKSRGAAVHCFIPRLLLLHTVRLANVTIQNSHLVATYSYSYVATYEVHA